nr:MAG TPA: hypothetical protein [Caudoviricetes sp.]
MKDLCEEVNRVHIRCDSLCGTAKYTTFGNRMLCKDIVQWHYAIV